METNENMALEVIETTEVMDTAEEIVNASSGNLLKTTAGIGLVVLGGVVAYKYLYKPMRAKFIAKKETQENETVGDDEIDDTTESDVEEVTSEEEQ